MILIADAAPLIFLGKINQLSLISKLFNAEIFTPSAVRIEILGPELPPDEERILTAFLSGCKIVDLKHPDIFARALSFADNCVLTLAHREGADLILSDDRLLRKVAIIEGFHVTGTIGVLLRARKKTLLSKKKATDLLNQLVEEHYFRIGIRVYEAARKAIANMHINRG